MKDRPSYSCDQASSGELEKELMAKYGPLVSGDDLRRLMGYPTMNAFRQALHRKNVEIPVFNIENRRGKYAYVKDLAKWIVAKRNQALLELRNQSKKED